MCNPVNEEEFAPPAKHEGTGGTSGTGGTGGALGRDIHTGYLALALVTAFSSFVNIF